ncbi:hypothetical protein RUM44_005742 [Polyplax serrata]|uniref:Uncharacterized protein n=1 Tax=Polyplax serrata TaxID=468196 RepID=A0ABR1AY90_POLSC
MTPRVALTLSSGWKGRGRRRKTSSLGGRDISRFASTVATLSRPLRLLATCQIGHPLASMCPPPRELTRSSSLNHLDVYNHTSENLNKNGSSGGGGSDKLIGIYHVGGKATWAANEGANGNTDCTE